VRHFTTEPNGQYTPKWDDEVDDGDVINLVLDIRNDCINRGFWDVTEESPATTRLKRPKSVPETDGQSSKKKKGDDTKTVGIEENTNSPSVSYIYTFLSKSAICFYYNNLFWLIVERRNSSEPALHFDEDIDRKTG